MRICLQRVTSAKCVVKQKTISSIDQGYMILVGFTHTDTLETVKKAAHKIACLRVFSDEAGKMNKSIQDIGGSILLISQFTLYADPTSGNRPSFTMSMKPELANHLYEQMVEILNDDYHIPTLKGAFGEHMELYPVCDGPVTINMEY